MLFNDPILAGLDQQVTSVFGPIVVGPALPEKQYFTDLVESIISQQLATGVATIISARVHQIVGTDFSPARVLATPIEVLRTAGLSTAKANYIQNIASAWESGEIVSSHLTKMTDEEVIVKLTTIKGVGRWTAEMFLMFCLARQDVFSVGDYGLKKAISRAYQVPMDSKPSVFLEIADTWRPYRTRASRILWKSLELQSR